MQQRWLFFATALASVLILTTFKQSLYQVVGWTMASMSCLAWSYFAYKDNDKPRFCMELMYFLVSIWGIINWMK